jgi:iron(III) transport system substrate-binding protein
MHTTTKTLAIGTRRVSRVGAAIALGAAAMLVTSCAGGAASTAEPTESGAVALPDYYPADYSELIEASKEESGTLSLYTNLAQPNLEPLIDAFQAQYPWISVSSAGDMSAEEVIQRYSAEASQKTTAADVLITAVAGEVWDGVIAGPGILEFTSAEKEQYDADFNPVPGLYGVAADPLVSIYNPMVLPEELRPEGLQDLARIVEENPDEFPAQSIITYDVSGFGYAGHKAVAENFDWGWDFYETIAPSTLAGPISGGDQLERISRGENKIALMTSGRTAFTGQESAAGLVEVLMIDDATVLYTRGMAISKYTANPASAQLFADFALSEQGQIALGQGKSTPIRDVPITETVPRTAASITEEIGEDNTVLVGLVATPGQEEFTKRFDAIFGLHG